MGDFSQICKNTELLSFLIRTVTVGAGISPAQLALADFTADVEFHQPPKSGQRPQEIFLLIFRMYPYMNTTTRRGL